jgi:hypothetical protein
MDAMESGKRGGDDAPDAGMHNLGGGNAATLAPEQEPVKPQSRPRNTLACIAFEPCRRNTLRGFASVQFRESRMTLAGVTIHTSHGRWWASPPARPMLDSAGNVIREPSGKVKYAPVISFDNPDVRTAFSSAVIAAVMRQYPSMFQEAPDDLLRLAEEGAE